MEEWTEQEKLALKKREKLEYYTLFKSPEELDEICKQLGKVDMTARALGLACRFRGVEWVKVLVENGAHFDYNNENVILPTSVYDFKYYYAMFHFWLAPLKFSETIKNGYHGNKMCDWCFPDVCTDKDGRKLEILPLEERIKCIEYLAKTANKTWFQTEDLYYHAIITNNFDIADGMKKLGFGLSDKTKDWLTRSSADTTDQWCGFIYELAPASDKEIYAIITRLREELGGEKLRYTDSVFYNLMSTWINLLSDPKRFEFIVENFDNKKMKKSEFMRHIIDEEFIADLPICEKAGWLKTAKIRDTMIQYASENGKTESTAWLMDFKNRTADFAAEREKSEKKMIRELNADPNSVGELKKIWTYKKQDDGTLILTSYKGSSTEVKIPEKIGKDTVAAIGEYALSAGNPRATQNYRQARKRITKIIVPDTIKRIDENAFSYCASLEEINLPEGITEISQELFKECSSLKSIKIPDSVTKICNSAFDACEVLEQVNITDKVTEIGEFAFFGCEKVKEFKIPESVKSIGKFAFSHCKSLERIKIPRGITEIKENTFANCFMLQSVEIPDTVETIGQYAFYDCDSLKTVELTNSVQNIAVYAFGMCGTLETIILPPSVKQIKNFTRSGKKPETIFDNSPNVTAIVEPKSYAEKYCKRNEIPYKYRED